ncbi:hypothetical protein TRIP_B200692 [uncultured Desulfatiglans sp.]|uniref:Uncharacterized protein n=1 Tax=Uncultured Desulfatiglans sp. TaxID=1748965 RepID=A0A653A4H0_UNCDX|nr:hypothetical protein TRIP_B200692 [uncultured Desulfatiglans sp.]
MRMLQEFVFLKTEIQKYDFSCDGFSVDLAVRLPVPPVTSYLDSIRKWFPGRTQFPIRKGGFFFTPFGYSVPPLQSKSRFLHPLHVLSPTASREIQFCQYQGN